MSRINPGERHNYVPDYDRAALMEALTWARDHNQSLNKIEKLCLDLHESNEILKKNLPKISPVKVESSYQPPDLVSELIRLNDNFEFYLEKTLGKKK